jgi:spore coat polysaccharide biosynthesis protein SpsF (cytidylyltransferase family)
MTRTIAVVQARMSSTRLPGKVLLDIGGKPLVLWVLDAVRAVPSVEVVVAAVTDEPDDDELIDVIGSAGYPIHRGPGRDVLTRCWEAVRPYDPTIVVRATSDTPFVDPLVIDDQVKRVVEHGWDYVGIAGWPVGIAGEAAQATAVRAAYEEATEDAEREHVMPFIYARPDRFRIGEARPTAPIPPGRFAVDTADDLAFIQAIAARLGPERPVVHAELLRIVTAEPDLLELNQDVVQKTWREAQH